MRADLHADVLAFYQRLREANRKLRCDFFEGVVMKRADTRYPVQLRSAMEECRGLMTIRFPADHARQSYPIRPAHFFPKIKIAVGGRFAVRLRAIQICQRAEC